MDIWIARLVWIVMPFTLGRAIGDATATWSSDASLVAEVLAWTAWTVGASALFAPRPWGLTALRVLCANALVIAITCAWWADGVTSLLAITSVAVVCAAALGAVVTTASVAAENYGDERRYPLRVPLPLLLAPVPFAAVVAGGGLVGPVLVFVNGNVVAGVLLALAGIPLALGAIRGLHGLAARLLVFVPAGLVVIDPLTLADPVLLLRENIVRVAPRDAVEPPAGALDLRVGTVFGSLLIGLSAPVSCARRRGKRDVEVVESTQILVAAVRSRAVAATARERLHTA